jgi:serine/threonine protein phosphatase PrpC
MGAVWKMIDFQASIKGNRRENLDFVVHLSANDVQAVIMVDGYRCTTDAVIKLLSSVNNESLIDEQTAKGLILKLKSEEEVNVSILCVLKTPTLFSIYSSGDCRVYDSRGQLLTCDHTNAWKNLKEKGISSDSIGSLVAKHPGRRVLTSSLRFPNPQYDGHDISISDIKPGSQFLLCTDGFWEHFDTSTVDNIIRRTLLIEDYLETMQGKSENSTACVLTV